ncbi:MAG: hypothetical protein IT430_07365 [Phycisphaerales bacterium]|nr:hypothetical protein [Phycisphaerales bacterium]
MLVLLIAAAAVAIPAMTRRFESTRFDATADQVIAMLALSRAESQRQRRPVQMLWEPGERALYAAWLDTGALEEQDAGASPDDRVDSAATPDAASEDEPLSARLGAAAGGDPKALALGGSRLRLVLPEGFRIQTRPPAEDDADGQAPLSGAWALAGDAARFSLHDAQPVSLLVYMPDGSTFGDASFTIVDAAGRQSRIEVNPWTGQATVTVMESAPADVGDALEPDSEAETETGP